MGESGGDASGDAGASQNRITFIRLGDSGGDVSGDAGASQNRITLGEEGGVEGGVIVNFTTASMG